MKCFNASRGKTEAKRFRYMLMQKQGRPLKRFISDKLRSYGTAKREIARAAERRSHKGFSTRAPFSAKACSRLLVYGKRPFPIPKAKKGARISVTGELAAVRIAPRSI